MSRTENLVQELNHLWERAGYTVEEQEPNSPLGLHLIAWKKQWFGPVYWVDVWIVCKGGSDYGKEMFDRKAALRKMIGKRFPLRLFRFSPYPYINVVVLGDAIVPDQEADGFAPDLLRHYRASFYTVTAINTTTRAITVRKNWTGSSTSNALLQAIAQLLTR